MRTTALYFLHICDSSPCTISSSHNQEEHTLYTQKLEQLPVQSTVSITAPYSLFEHKLRNKNKFKTSKQNNPEGNTVFKLIYTNLIQYCSLRTPQTYN